MSVARFEANTAVRIEGKEFLLSRKIDDETWQLEDCRTKRVIEKSITELHNLFLDRELTFEVDAELAGQRSDSLEIGKPHLELSETQFAHAKMRRAYIKAIEKLPAATANIKAAIEAQWSRIKQPAKPPHLATVYRWRARFVAAGGDIRSVVGREHCRGNRDPRYPDAVIDFVDKAIDAVYLTRERRPMQDVLDRAIADINRENKLRHEGDKLPLPTRQLVKRKIYEIPAFDRCVAREGRTVAMKRFRSVKRHRTTQFPLERCEIDHTQLDLMVLDDHTGLPLGRPYLTVCIDDNTRCILGLHLGFEPPSLLVVARCLKHAFMPKSRLRETYPEIENEWEPHGIAAIASVDNGLEFHGSGLEQAALELGMEIEFSPRKTPWHKGKVERFIKTFNAEVAHGAPGTTFSNIFEKDEYDPLKHAVVRKGTLQKIAMMWVADVYHQREHRTLKVAPAQAWNSRINVDDIRVPADPDRLDAILGRRFLRTLTHKGIEYDGLLYNSPDLGKLRMKLGEKLSVEISVNDGDIGSIIVFSPDKTRMFNVPALNQAYANGLTAWQHRVCKKFAAREDRRYDSSGWIAAKERIAELIREEFAQKKKRARGRVARYQEAQEAAAAKQPTAAPAAQSPAPKPSPAPAPKAEPAAIAPSLGATFARKFAAIVRQR